MKVFKLVIICTILVIGLAACGNMATLEIVNDTDVNQDYAVKINGEWEDSNLSITMTPDGMRSFSYTGGIEYTVYRSKLSTSYLWNGSVATGDTAELKFSEAE